MTLIEAYQRSLAAPVVRVPEPPPEPAWKKNQKAATLRTIAPAPRRDTNNVKTQDGAHRETSGLAPPAPADRLGSVRLPLVPNPQNILKRLAHQSRVVSRPSPAAFTAPNARAERAR